MLAQDSYMENDLKINKYIYITIEIFHETVIISR